MHCWKYRCRKDNAALLFPGAAIAVDWCNILILWIILSQFDFGNWCNGWKNWSSAHTKQGGLEIQILITMSGNTNASFKHLSLNWAGMKHHSIFKGSYFTNTQDIWVFGVSSRGTLISFIKHVSYRHQKKSHRPNVLNVNSNIYQNMSLFLWYHTYPIYSNIFQIYMPCHFIQPKLG